MPRRIKKSPIGRPTIFDEPMTRVNVTLSEQDLERARKIGNGNVSHGIRLALERVVGKINQK